MAFDLKNPIHQKTLLSFLGVAAVGYLYFAAAFVPGNFRAHAKRLSELKTRYEQLSSDLTKAQQSAASLDRLEQESRRLRQQWVEVREQLPDQRELASLLRRITLSGSQSGVHFLLFKPQPPAASEYYTDNPVQITVVGAYHQVGSFLSEVAGLGRLVNSHDLNLTSTVKENTDITTQASFVASAYTLGGTGPVLEEDKKNPKKSKDLANKGAAHNAKPSVAKVTP